MEKLGFCFKKIYNFSFLVTIIVVLSNFFLMLLVFIQWTIYVANKNYYVVKIITWMKKDNLNETISLLYDLQMSNFIIVILNKKIFLKKTY
jgi:hypothetical protein